MARFKQSKRIVFVEDFVEDATKIHKTLMKYAGQIDAGCAHAKLLQAVHEPLLKAIREVSGKEVPWMTPTPASWGPGGPKSQG